jgi:hypothetical protein
VEEAVSYKVYADGALLYAPGNDDSTTLISPTLTREVNSAGSFEATVPPCNALVNSLSKLKTTIEVQQDGETIWRGRVLEDEKDFYNRRKIYCEGELSYLSDTAIPTFYHAQTYVYSGFVYEDTTISAFLAGCLGVHNKLADSSKQFLLGNVTVTSDESKITFGDGNTYGTTWEVINNQLIDTYGGYLVIRYENGARYLDYLADLTDTSAQTIEFGANLLDFVDSTTAADTYTRLIPLGDYTEWAGESTDRRLTIALVDKDDKPKEQLYVRDEAAENLFGVITHVELFDGVTDHNELYTKAKATLAENIYLSATYTVSAVDLKDAGADVERIKFGSKVRVISKPHNVDMEVLCTALTEPLAQPDKKTYTLGKTVKTMTDRSVAVHKESSATANATTAAQSTASDATAKLALWSDKTDSNKIAGGQVATGTVNGSALANSAVSTDKLASNAVSTSKLAKGAVLNALWTNNSPTSKFTYQTITIYNVADTYSELAIVFNGDDSTKSTHIAASTAIAVVGEGGSIIQPYPKAYSEEPKKMTSMDGGISDILAATRFFYAYKDGNNICVRFSACITSDSSGNVSQSSYESYYCIPYHIYGIK